MTALLQPVRQIAYAVDDVVLAAERHHKLFGSGPFFMAEHVLACNFVHRGIPGTFDHTTLFGQWGDVMIEFVTQHNDGPSYIHDMYPYRSGTWGLHHVALIVSDFQATLAAFNAQGFETASRFHIPANEEGFDVAFLDTRSVNGHMVEIYQDIPPILGAYEMCRKAAGYFAGRPLIQAIAF